MQKNKDSFLEVLHKYTYINQIPENILSIILSENYLLTV